MAVTGRNRAHGGRGTDVTRTGSSARIAAVRSRYRAWAVVAGTLAAVACVPAATPPAAPAWTPSPQALAAIDSIVRAAVEGRETAGISAGIAAGGRVIYSVGDGRASREAAVEQLLAPPSLRETGACSGDAPQLASGYSRRGDAFEPAISNQVGDTFADGDLCSSARDLLRWTSALARGAIIPQASYHRIEVVDGRAIRLTVTRAGLEFVGLPTDAPDATSARRATPVPMPHVDHHAHAWSEAAAAAVVDLKRHYGYPAEPGDSLARTAEMIVAAMDSAGLQRSVVLSAAYLLAAEALAHDDVAARVRRENEWLADAVRRFPDRLTGFCSVNPVADWALTEIEWCARNPNLTGLKLHFPNSGVDFSEPAHVERLVAVFEAANRGVLPLVVHLWTPAWESDHAVARRDADLFLRRLLAAAPAVPVQVAHLAGGGAFSPGASAALEVLVEGIAEALSGTANLWFDIAAVLHPQHPAEAKDAMAQRIRQIGTGRILYGADGSPLAADWPALLAALPLTESEFEEIRTNTAPYLR
jgi:uncharacterized protein